MAKAKQSDGAASTYRELSLAGQFQLTSPKVKVKAPITLPGDVHAALLAQDEIPDPYFADNETRVMWVHDTPWHMERKFTATPADVDGYLLANSLEALGGEVANQANLQLTGSRSRTPLQLPGAEATDPPEPSPREEAEASRPRTIWWINGPFGVGKTTLVERLLERDPSLWSFDPERVGDFLRGVIPERVRDYQSWRAWRALTTE